MSSFVRGQLDLSKQKRQPPGKQHLINISHDIFLLNRIEHRLIKTALQFVVRLGKSPGVSRLANELSHKLSELEPVANSMRLTNVSDAKMNSKITSKSSEEMSKCEFFFAEYCSKAIASEGTSQIKSYLSSI